MLKNEEKSEIPGNIIISTKELIADLESGGGDVVAQYNLAAFYTIGITMDVDYDKAYYWCKKAADGGLSEAKYYLAMMLINSISVKQNLKNAVSNLKLAGYGDENRAQFTLGVLHMLGKGVEKSKDKAFVFFEMAARSGHVRALYNLAIMYEFGIGVRKNHKESVRILKIAAGYGSEDAKKFQSNPNDNMDLDISFKEMDCIIDLSEDGYMRPSNLEDWTESESLSIECTSTTVH